jgi:uncharacterized membrane protein
MLFLFLIGLFVIPLLTFGIMFFAAVDDFWDIIRLRIGFERLFGDLVRIMAILSVGIVFWLVDIVMVFTHL